LLSAPHHATKPVFLEHTQRTPDLCRRLVAAEVLPDFIPRYAPWMPAKFSQDFIGGRVAQRIPEDETGGILAVLPYRKSSQKVLSPDCCRAVKQGIESGQAHRLGLGPRRDCAQHSRLALAQVRVDITPDGPRLFISTHFARVSSEYYRRLDSPNDGCEIHGMQRATLREHLGSSRAHPQKPVGETVPRRRVRE
jgi:hypothetical protein